MWRTCSRCFSCWAPQAVQGRTTGGHTDVATNSPWSACAEPGQVRRYRLAQGRREVLVQWKGLPPAEAAWTTLEEFQKLYPKFQLEDKLLAEGGEMSW
jgi:hypothetical protein